MNIEDTAEWAEYEKQQKLLTANTNELIALYKRGAIFSVLAIVAGVWGHWAVGIAALSVIGAVVLLYQAGLKRRGQLIRDEMRSLGIEQYHGR